MLALNRSALVVTAKQPFLDWLHGIDPDSADLTLATLREEPAVYLLAECGDDRAFEYQLRKHFAVIFEEELRGWYNDPSTWPGHRTYRMFRQWFDVSVHSMVIDLTDRPLFREDM